MKKNIILINLNKNRVFYFNLFLVQVNSSELKIKFKKSKYFQKFKSRLKYKF